MADIPLAVLFEGDYGYKVQVFDSGDTMAALIDKAAAQLVGVLVAPPLAGAVFEVRAQGGDSPLPRDLTIEKAGFAAMEAVEIYRAR